MAKSIDDINATLPELEAVFEQIATLHERSASLSRDIQSLFDIWGEHLRSESNPDHGFYQEKLKKKGETNKELQALVARVESLGGVVKDLEKGLVDFVFEHSGDRIYLCWKKGEKKIEHWHPLRGGFAARRPLTDLPQAQPI